MNDTFTLILKLSEERQQLYFLAGKQPLTADQRQRLEALNNKLPVLWDAYRRELAGSKRSAAVLTRPVSDRRVA